MSHKAAWIKAKSAKIEVDDAQTPTPAADEVLVKIGAIALNPVEAKVQRYNIFPMEFPGNLGWTYGGTIESVGSSVTNLKVGDKVAVNRAESTLNDARYGSHQQKAITSARVVSKLDPKTSIEDGAATIVNLSTIFAVFTLTLGLDRPNVAYDAAAPASKGQKVLVYGGTSSCGGLAINYLTAAGYEVVTTSSPKHHGHVASQGPSVVIDHTLPEKDVISALHAHGPYSHVLDTIGSPAVTNLLVEYLSAVGGGRYITLNPVMGGVKPIPENVEPFFGSFGGMINLPEHAQYRDWFYDELLPVGLASGKIVATRTQIIPGGLEKVQEVLDLLGDGKVSGVKMIVDPWA